MERKSRLSSIGLTVSGRHYFSSFLGLKIDLDVKSGAWPDCARARFNAEIWVCKVKRVAFHFFAQVLLNVSNCGST